ncbi:hypothetical protein Hypma_003856 [Hypsizygus marmoreus]|uniref:RRM domain-containing protein n=1 Tax=Hypsizygus marmoreus TaxID=39966 RepID=A0A369K6Y2_HYPMA|nr:hypothetical protein Hypma_003856 [Hypsizygus marmoreus]
MAHSPATPPRSVAFSPTLPPLPDSPLSSKSLSPPVSFSFQSPHSLNSSQSMPRSITASPSSSLYQSTSASPNSSARSREARRRHETTDEDSDSSDVEIYLTSLGLDDSLTSQRQHVPTNCIPEPDESPILPALLSHTGTALQAQTQLSPPSSPPQLPPAPAQQTIPLPDVSSTGDVNENVFTRQMQKQSLIFVPKARATQQVTATIPPSEHAAGTSTRSGPGSISTSTSGVLDAGSDKTPNVYINGLPPHFPEDQLFALAAPFGAIRSVRTFTRHVRDNESGYGFVLFETVEAAEKCILSLRRYRNLHPTFSKQAHKIPGSFSQLNLHLENDTPPDSVSASSLAEWEQEHSRDVGEDASFKAKMEALHDVTSTNLYMEGLPLSIDEPTLAALVSPHRINSSRFFQTRLSNPPRIIAFVRFETRAGAEEIIERLHGRMVRGWNDTGSRISVRFADTAEQRELRRQERLNKDGEQSPARLTIAQAALLNLHGQDLRKAAVSPALSAHNPLPPLVLDRRIPHSHSSHSLGHHHSHSSNNLLPLPHPHVHPDYSRLHTHTPPFTVDYTLRPAYASSSRTQTPSPYHGHASLPLPHAHSHASLSHAHRLPHPSHPLQLPPPSNMNDRPPPPMDPTMAALLDSLRGGGTPFHPMGSSGAGNIGGNPYAGAGHDLHGHSHHLASNRASHGHGHLASSSIGSDYGTYHGGVGGNSTRTGYTATEEFIMRAHAQAENLNNAGMGSNSNAEYAQRRRPPPLDLNARRRRDSDAAASVGVGVRGYRAQGAAVNVGLGGGVNANMNMNSGMGLMSEEEFHAGGVGARGDEFRPPQQQQQQKHGHNHRIHPPHVNARLGGHGGGQQQHQHQLHHQQTQGPPLSQQAASSPSMSMASLSPALSQQQHQYQQAHLRSSTLPPLRTSTTANQRHYQHSSMSIPTSTSTSTLNNSNTNAMKTRTNINSNTSNVNNTSNNNNNVYHAPRTPSSTQHQHQHTSNSNRNSLIMNKNSNSNGNGANMNTNNNNNNNGDAAISIYDSAGAGEDAAISVSVTSAYDVQAKALQHHAHQRLHQHHHAQQKKPTANNNNNNNNNFFQYETTQIQTQSPSLVSPALTYSSHTHTPSTLSPATPFFGSFGSQTDGFEGVSDGMPPPPTPASMQLKQGPFEGKKMRSGSR